MPDAGCRIYAVIKDRWQGHAARRQVFRDDPVIAPVADKSDLYAYAPFLGERLRPVSGAVSAVRRRERTMAAAAVDASWQGCCRSSSRRAVHGFGLHAAAPPAALLDKAEPECRRAFKRQAHAGRQRTGVWMMVSLSIRLACRALRSTRPPSMQRLRALFLQPLDASVAASDEAGGARCNENSASG
jgi:hypothetical protein